MVEMRNEYPKTAPKGERTCYRYIQTIFSADPSVICYHNPYVNGLRPDFVLFSSHFGIILIEVKDYVEENLVLIEQSGRI